MGYRRSRTGDTVHRADCARAKTALDWTFADGFTADDIVQALANYPWLKPCQFCRPDVNEEPP